MESGPEMNPKLAEELQEESTEAPLKCPMDLGMAPYYDNLWTKSWISINQRKKNGARSPG